MPYPVTPQPPRTPDRRPAPPAVGPGPSAKVDRLEVLGFMADTLDRNKNGLLEDDEARLLGTVGNGNGANGTKETARSLFEGEAIMYGFQLARDVAAKIAEKLSGGNAWISRDDFPISDEARAKLDADGDRRIAREELVAGLNRGGYAINGQGIVTSDEAKQRFNASSPRPTPPRPSVDRPAPPPVVLKSPQDVVDRFNRGMAALATAGLDVFAKADKSREFLGNAYAELEADTKHAPFAERKRALNAINSPYVDVLKKADLERAFLATAQDHVMADRSLTFRQAKAALNALESPYVDVFKKADLERTLVAREFERIKAMPASDPSGRKAALADLQNASPYVDIFAAGDLKRQIEAEAARDLRY